MYLLKVVNNDDWTFTTTYYEYDEEKRMLEAARHLASKGVECVVFKPYKKFEKPKPEVVEVDV